MMSKFTINETTESYFKNKILNIHQLRFLIRLNQYICSNNIKFTIMICASVFTICVTICEKDKKINSFEFEFYRINYYMCHFCFCLVFLCIMCSNFLLLCYSINITLFLYVLLALFFMHQGNKKSVLSTDLSSNFLTVFYLSLYQ